MSFAPPKSNNNVPVAPEPPSLSQPSQGSSEGPNPRTLVTLVVLSYKVLRVDVNRKHGQIRKVSETRLKLQLEDLARVPPAGIIKALLVWPENRMLLHLHLHFHRFCFVLGANFFCNCCSGQFLDQFACVSCGTETSR